MAKHEAGKFQQKNFASSKSFFYKFCKTDQVLYKFCRRMKFVYTLDIYTKLFSTHWLHNLLPHKWLHVYIGYSSDGAYIRWGWGRTGRPQWPCQYTHERYITTTLWFLMISLVCCRCRHWCISYTFLHTLSDSWTYLHTKDCLLLAT